MFQQFHSLRSRLMLVYVGLTLLGFGSLTLYAGNRMESATWDNYGNGVQLDAVQLAAEVSEEFEYGITHVVPEIDRFVSTRGRNVAIFADDVLQYATDTEYVLSSISDLDRWTAKRSFAGNDLVVATTPILYEGATLGYVQVTADAAEPQRAVRTDWLALLTAFTVFTIVSGGCSLWLIRTMTQPLTILEQTALELASGDLNYRVAHPGDDEIGAVGTAFNQMADNVQQMLLEQKAFASNASHELRTPLTTIRLRTEAIIDNFTPELNQQYIQDIDQEARRMSGLVEDLILLSRYDAKRLKIGVEELDLYRVTRGLVHELQPIAKAKSVKLNLTPETSAFLPVVANLTHARVVLRNIIDNAVKYTLKGEVNVRLSQSADHVIVEVQDTGIGIADQDMPRIGQRFFRTDRAHTREIPGVGLGVALVRAIVDLYHGEFKMDSAGPDCGTTVTVRWPSTMPEPGAAD